MNHSAIYRLLFLCLFAIHGFPAFADGEFSNVQFLSLPSDLLPSPEVRKLYQDSDGYIWIPTYNGLSRYDGYDFVNYGVKDAVGGQFNTFVNVLAEDTDKILWVGTERGIFRLDKKTGIITADVFPTLSDCNVTSIICESNGGMWVGGDKGLFRKDPSKKSFRQIPLNSISSKPITAITSIVGSKDGNYLWVAAFDQGLFRFRIDKEETSRFTDPVLLRAHALAKDASGDIWVGTWGAGLARLRAPYSSANPEYDLFRHESGNPLSLLDDIIYDIEQDVEQNTIWVGSRSGVSVLYDVKDPHSFQNFLPGANYGDLPFNEVNSILQSRDGMMWIGMLGGGVSKAVTNVNKFETYRLEPIRRRYNTSSVRSMYNLGNGEYWFGLLDFGIIRYDINTGKITDYHSDASKVSFPYTSTVNSIIRRSTNGRMYFGTQNAGIIVYDEAKGEVTQQNNFSEPKLLDNCVIAQCEDSEGNLWIGSRTGVYVESHSGEFMTLAEWLGKPSPFDKAFVFNICKDGDGHIWIASNGQGIFCVNVGSRRWRQFTNGNGMISDCVYSLQADKNGRVWAGTVADGLAVFDKENECFRPIGSFPNLMNKGITNIVRDRDDRMWLTTSNTVFSFSVDEQSNPERINTFIVSSGSSSFSFSRNTSSVSDDGTVAFCGSGGLMIFSDPGDRDTRAELPIAFTDLKINDYSIMSMDEQERSAITDKDINYTDHITLSHKQNNFNIEFSLLTYTNPSDYMFKYKLDGVNHDYLVVDSQHRFASYSNLRAGRYTFHLMAAGENGVWGSNEKTLVVHILPPWWNSWQAYIAYTLLFFGFVWMTFVFSRRRIRLYKEIQISKLERQKVEELNHVKLQFFTNVTHELMTPLTIIQASLQNLSNGTGDKQKLYDVMSSNATRLMRLIQQILEFRKVESGNLKIKVSKGEIVSFVRKCIESFAPLIAKKQLKVSFLCKEDKIDGWFDSDKLDKIVYNLMSNAAKYTPQGGSITVSVNSETAGAVDISVANSGDLMDEKTISGLFKRFYDGSYRKFNTVGTGIGLSLVKDMLSIHKGSIKVTSTPEEGNCFRVSLPIGREAYSDEEIDDSFDSGIIPVTETLPQNEEKSDHTLLIVDDNDELLFLMSNLLKPYFAIETAVNGKEALDVLSKKQIDLVVSDVMMPVMDGIELCKAIKSTVDYSHIPVILLTAKIADEDQVEGFNSGADGYVTKPFNIQVLFAQIQNLLRKIEKRGQKFQSQNVLEVKKLDYTSLVEKFMVRIVECVNEHIEDSDFSLSDFTKEMNMSRTVLTEKLKSLTGLTPTAFVLDVRLRSAYRLLEEQHKMRISDLAYASGFNDPKYFSTCFKKKYGVSPKEFMDKFR